MTTQQPEALRLADAVRTHDDHPRVHFYNRVAAELRRLHAESELHLQELASYRFTVENRDARIVEMEARVQELEVEKARLIETYVPCPSATEAYMYGITQEKQG